MRPDDANQKRLTGVLDVVRSGKKGYFIREGVEEDVEVPAEWLGGALSGDVVEVVLGPKYGKTMARVVSVIERNSSTFVGTVLNGKDGLYLRPDNTRVYFDFRIEGTSGATVGTKVVADVVSWDAKPPTVAVTQVLGVAGEHETEMRAIIISRGFESSFPPDVLAEAEALYTRGTEEGDAQVASGAREDFRQTLTFTIDPDDAKDFDDAISYKELPDGNLEVGVHIADVSYFIDPKGAIEREAYKRATSVYLVDRTVPMLPPVLSEDLCSLMPNVDRMTFSAVFTVNGNNDVVGRRFVRSIIHSAKRFTYDEADISLNDAAAPYHTELARLWTFASKLRTERKAQGAVMFDKEEIRPVLDASKKVIGFKKSEYTESHQLIEELMLLANREVATFVTQKLGRKNRLFVYRVHDKPDPDKLDELSVFLRAVGYALERGQDGVTGKDINKLLDSIKGTPEEQLIKTATVRSMAKAVYTTKNIGHFGLSFDAYSNFTSPIRRYPDLMVHRVLGVLIRGEQVTENPLDQERRAVHASEREVLASEAERASIKLKQVEFFAALIGQTRSGVVAGVTEWGVYIADKETGAEGMARMMTLTDDTYEYVPGKFAVVGVTTKRTIRLGDPVTFTVESIDLENRTIDFKIVNET